ncbi:MAG: hypothetical protein WAK01_14775 [Methylocystis sp.]
MSGSGPDRSQKSSPTLGRKSLDVNAPELDEATQLRLGGFLARRADQLVRDPLPDVFLLLLAKMNAKEEGE